MNCDELLRRLTDYSERSLSQELCREIEQHVAGCTRCAELEHDLEDLRRLCRECPSPRLPDALRKRVQEMLEER